MEKRWIYKPASKKNDIEKMSLSLNIDELLANLLIQRGIKTFEQARNFFRPDLDKLYDPFLMKDMNLAVERIEEALQKKQKILVYGDYDVDGTTSVAMVFSFLKKIDSNVDYYIPDRYKEGYGISFEGIDYAHKHGVSLIIALDCGIKASKKVDYAKSRGIDFVICDHHTPEDKIPDAFAVLDPKRPDCNYPFKELSGCGVGFKMLQAYVRTKDLDQKILYEYLDLIAVSIASDIVPIIDENRILAYYGLRQLNDNPQPGLKAILDISGMNNRNHNLAIDDIVFRIGPRINATGRVESAKKSVELLLSTNHKEVERIANKVNNCNNERKSIDRHITQDALRMISTESTLNEKKATVLYNSNWHKGVVGIVASRIIEIYYRPTIILTASNGMATGSARSVPGFDIYHALEECSDLLENFGGHRYAAGLTLDVNNIDKFKRRFEEIVEDTITEEQLIPHIEIDSEIDFSQITRKFYNILRQFQPFGPMNLAPVFSARNVIIDGQPRLVGASKEHIKLSLKQINDSQNVFPAIAFQQANYYYEIQKGKPFSICFAIEENNFRGNTTIQLNIKDIKFDN
ncbi:MAG: single-stranded-DNA-specific exonuclease RecJ [Bacteroidales bacterium]